MLKGNVLEILDYKSIKIYFCLFNVTTRNFKSIYVVYICGLHYISIG